MSSGNEQNSNIPTHKVGYFIYVDGECCKIIEIDKGKIRAVSTKEILVSEIFVGNSYKTIKELLKNEE